MKIDKLFADFMNNPLIKFSIFMVVCIFLVISIYMFVFPTKEGFKDPTKAIIKGMKKALLDPIMKPIMMIVNAIKCAIRLVVGFPSCFGYYLIELIKNLIYLPFAIIFSILNITKHINKLWKKIEEIDKEMYNNTGHSILKFKNSVMNKCFRCTPKKEVRKVIKETEEVLPTNINKIEDTKSTQESIGNAILSALIIIGIGFFLLIVIANAFGVTLFAVSFPIGAVSAIVSPMIGAVGAVVGSTGYLAKKTIESAVQGIGPVGTPSIDPFKSSSNPNYNNIKDSSTSPRN